MTRPRRSSGDTLSPGGGGATDQEHVARHLQGFRPLAISGDVEVPDGSSLAVKVTGNVLQHKQDPFTGEFLAVSSARSQDVKEPFVFRAFEDNSMTLFVQPRDQDTPMAGTLAFSRKLEHIRSGPSRICY